MILAWKDREIVALASVIAMAGSSRLTSRFFQENKRLSVMSWPVYVLRFTSIAVSVDEILDHGWLL